MSVSYTHLDVYKRQNKLKTNNENETYNKQLTNTLKIILNQNYFQYNNKLYIKQCMSLALGPPTSSITSEIILQKLYKLQKLCSNNK